MQKLSLLFHPLRASALGLRIVHHTTKEERNFFRISYNILYCNSQQYRLGQILMNYSVNPNKMQGTNAKRGSP